MEFLNKLYESDYFGIGLFVVISFLVISFLIVLFFGKRDEKKRNANLEDDNSINTFKETTSVKPVEVSDVGSSVILDNAAKEIEQPVSPIINNMNVEPVKVVEPVVMTEDIKTVEPIIPKVKETITPIINETSEVVKPVDPIRLEPVKYEIPNNSQIVEPIRVNIPDEPVKITPIEEIKPIIQEEKPVIIEPTVTESFYKPIEPINKPEVAVPNVDFDALAKSISDELDELEEKSNERRPENNIPTSNQFSSVYVNEPVVNSNTNMGMELPTMKKEEIKPESYDL